MTEASSTTTDQAGEEPARPREIASADLLQGARSILIRHDGQAYRLLLTRNNRLILQK